MSKNEKENIDFDALTYGITEGGLRSTLEINLLICYLVVNSKCRLTEKLVIDTMTEGEIANYFEATSALKKLIERQTVILDENGFLVPGKNCENLMELVENDLPYSIRKKSIELSAKLAVKELYKEENKVEINKKDDNSYDVTMHIQENGKDFMTLTLNLPTSAQAQMVEDRFYDNPPKLYKNLIDYLFREDSESEDN